MNHDRRMHAGLRVRHQSEQQPSGGIPVRAHFADDSEGPAKINPNKLGKHSGNGVTKCLLVLAAILLIFCYEERDCR